jgi:hypothetical protein
MKTITKIMITTCPPEERYGSRAITIALSDEVFMDKEIGTITNMVVLAAMRAGFLFETSTTKIEVCETEAEKEERAFIEKAEKEEREAKEILRIEKQVAEVVIAAAAVGTEYTYAIETALEDLPVYQREPVRAMLKERNLYTLSA